MATSIPVRILESGKAYITQVFKAKTHRGIDLVNCNALGRHTTGWVVAHSDGKVSKVVSDINWTKTTGSSYGNYVTIDHGDGYQTLYAHLKYGTIKVQVGQEIKQGDRIGYMGNTGHSSGAHLHFEVRKNGEKIDPTPYLNANLADEPWEPKVGEVCKFIGNTHYSNANASVGKACNGNKVLIRRIYRLGKPKHPYSVISTGGGNVRGWVDAEDLEQLK